MFKILKRLFNKHDSLKVRLPYGFGTFMKTIRDGKVLFCGTVVGYTVAEDGLLIFISGYRIPQCGEFLLEEVVPMTDDEIKELIKEFE